MLSGRVVRSAALCAVFGPGCYNYALMRSGRLLGAPGGSVWRSWAPVVLCSGLTAPGLLGRCGVLCVALYGLRVRSLGIYAGVGVAALVGRSVRSWGYSLPGLYALPGCICPLERLQCVVRRFGGGVLYGYGYRVKTSLRALWRLLGVSWAAPSCWACRGAVFRSSDRVQVLRVCSWAALIGSGALPGIPCRWDAVRLFLGDCSGVLLRWSAPVVHGPGDWVQRFGLLRAGFGWSYHIKKDHAADALRWSGGLGPGFRFLVLGGFSCG